MVHTLGSLLENSSYKNSLKENNIPALLGSLFRSATSDFGGPLEQERDSNTSYKVINRDSGEDFAFPETLNLSFIWLHYLITCISFKSALRVCEAFVASPAEIDPKKTRPFVYVSAEDIFRPVISARYIETKREAERAIEQMTSLNSQFRGVYIRPSEFIR